MPTLLKPDHVVDFGFPGKLHIHINELDSSSDLDTCDFGDTALNIVLRWTRSGGSWRSYECLEFEFDSPARKKNSMLCIQHVAKLLKSGKNVAIVYGKTTRPIVFVVGLLRAFKNVTNAKIEEVVLAIDKKAFRGASIWHAVLKTEFDFEFSEAYIAANTTPVKTLKQKTGKNLGKKAGEHDPDDDDSDEEE